MKLRVVVALAAACVLTMSACGSGTAPAGTHTCPPAGGPGCPVGQIYMLVAERNAGSVSLFPQLPYNGLPRTTLAAPGAQALTWSLPSDTARTLYVGEYPNTIAVFGEGSLTQSGSISAGVIDPAGLQTGVATNPVTKSLDESLFVANRGANNVEVFDLADTSRPAFTIGGLNAPNGLAFDLRQNLWVSEASDVVEFGAPISASSKPLLKITTGLQTPGGIAFDLAGATMYVTDRAQNAILVYPAGATAPSAVVTTGLNGPAAPYVIGDANSGFIFVPNRASNTVAEYNLPLTASSSPVATSSAGMGGPSAVTFGFYPF